MSANDECPCAKKAKTENTKLPSPSTCWRSIWSALLAPFLTDAYSRWQAVDRLLEEDVTLDDSRRQVDLALSPEKKGDTAAGMRPFLPTYAAMECSASLAYVGSPPVWTRAFIYKITVINFT